MRINLLKLTITISLGVLFAIYSLNGSAVSAFSFGPPSARTGAPALGGSPAEGNCTSCHMGSAVNSGGGTFTITAPANYSPGQDVAVTVNISQASRALYGFQLTALNDQGQKAGDLVAPNDGRTSVVPGGARQYIQHTTNGTSPTAAGQNSWTFTWRAPAQSAGRVTFYASGNAANGNGQNTGDSIYTTSKGIDPASTPLGPFTSVSAAGFSGSVPLTANGIAAGFGTGLSQNIAMASAVPLPTTLDGTSVLVNGVAAGLFFVAPTQINYLVPAGTANGNATILVRRNGVDTAQGTTPIETVAPGLFSANANGQGVAAALLFRRRGAVDTFEPVAQFNSGASRFDPLELDLGPQTDVVLLIVFGAGFRRISAQTAATAMIGGEPAPVSFVGPTPGFEGLDQANISIPRSLIGRKLVNVVFTADGKTANTVQISIK